MLPVYRYMESNPHSRNQEAFPQHHFPAGFEAVPPHLNVDPSKSPMVYESWPCSSNYSYPVPFHGCCNYANFPGYYSFKTPCPHFAPSPALHHYPNYPAFPEAYPVYYVPPPHYYHEQPRYGYDNDAPTNYHCCGRPNDAPTNYHCCGCPNHPHSQKNSGSLKIEEQEPDAEKKQHGSVFPIQPRNYPYPIVWIPPDYMKSKEQEKRDHQPKVSDWDKALGFVKPAEQEPNSYPIVWIPPEYVKNKEYGKQNDQREVSNWDKASGFVKPPKSVKPTPQQPRVSNGWFPLDMNGLKSLMQGRGEKNSENQQNEAKMTQFPYPIFWLPSDGKPKEDENEDKKRMLTASDQSKQPPVSFKFIPVDPSNNNVRADKSQSNEEISHNETASEMMEKTASQKCPPIEKTEHREDKSEGAEKRGRDISVKRTGDNDTAKNELGTTTAKRKSSSPSKASKLSPVCLRVDPLPKKRNGEGSSRSPSPPKEQSEGTLTKASTAPGLKEDLAVNPQNLDGSLNKVAREEKKIKDIPVIAKISEESKARESISVSQTRRKEVSEKPTEGKTEKVSDDSETIGERKASSEEFVQAEKAADPMNASNHEESPHSHSKAERRKMSDVEAAKLIQSAYRGFEVRKWEPLKKLKQIARVREQLDEVRNRIQALESSSNHDRDDRQRLLIGETIMSLLLKLDTIQGLHSSLRDARKSLVRELVTLQEKLDSLTSMQAEEKAKELSTAESAGCTSVDASSKDSMEKESKKASAVCITSEKGIDIKESDQDYVLHTLDEKPDVKDEETTDLDQALDGTIETGTAEVTCDIECPTAPRMEDGACPYLEQQTDLSSVPEQKSYGDERTEANDQTRDRKVVGVNDQILVGNNNLEDDIARPRSLPKEKTDHVDATSEPEKEIGNSDGEKESDIPMNLAFPSESEKLWREEKEREIQLLEELPVRIVDESEAENLRCEERDQEIELLEELPVGIIDEEPAIREFEKSEMHESRESNTLSSTDAGYQSNEQLLEATLGNSVKGKKENKLASYSEPEGKTGKTQQEVVKTSENKSEPVLKPEKVPLTADVEENNDKALEEEENHGVIDVDGMASSESEVGSVATQDKQVVFEEKKEVEQQVETQQMDNEINVPQKEGINDEDKITIMPHESADERVLVETDALSEPNVEQELLPPSLAASQLSNSERDLARFEEDNKLIEENKKLREMMEKLMEAGKDQLAVISNLTGRVKDLEEKLSKNKKISKPRYRKARFIPSHSRPMRPNGRTAEVAM